MSQKSLDQTNLDLMSLAQALLTFSALIFAAPLSIDGVLTGFDGARLTVFAEGARSARNLNGKKIRNQCLLPNIVAASMACNFYLTLSPMTWGGKLESVDAKLFMCQKSKPKESIFNV